MIARLLVQLPYMLAVPDGESFNIYQQTIDGYAVEVYPPVRARDSKNSGCENLTIDGKKGIEADVLRVDFLKDSFVRTDTGPIDPPVELMAKVLNDFNARLRTITRAAHAEPVDFPHCNWHLQYLNDDGSELPKAEGLYRGRGGRAYRWQFTACTPLVWDEMAKLPAPFEAPVWDTLRLDAVAALPKVGSALVLAAASLEVFIGQVLNGLAQHKSFPPGIWKWINNRGNWLREPTVEEEFDSLLKHFTGHSLKEDSLLWEALKNIRAARNSFAHAGVAEIGGAVISPDKAGQLIQRVHDIIERVRAWLPDELRWPSAKVEAQIAWTQLLREGTDSGERPQNEGEDQ